MSLGAGGRGWEVARLPASDRHAAAVLERTAEDRARAMLAAIETLQDKAGRRDVAGARNAWIEARTRFVQLEPLLARADREFTEELNGEPGKAAGFHAVEAKLFLEGAPWASGASERAALLADAGDLLARCRVAAGRIRAMTIDPATMRDAWVKHGWTLIGRIDGQECYASQTSISEWRAIIDAMDIDLGRGGYYTSPIRNSLSEALTKDAAGSRLRTMGAATLVEPTQLHSP